MKFTLKNNSHCLIIDGGDMPQNAKKQDCCMSTEKGCMKHACVLIVAVFFLVCCQSIEGASANSMEIEKQEEFVKLFDYEVQNRALALISLQNLSKDEENPVKKEFWDAYLALECLNQKRYQPFANKYSITQEPKFMASLKASLLVKANDWFPSYIWETIHDAGSKYVEKLEEMATLADEDDKDFFSYVVSQERVQVEAIRLMINGKVQQAVELLSDFVAKQNKTNRSENRMKRE